MKFIVVLEPAERHFKLFLFQSYHFSHSSFFALLPNLYITCIQGIVKIILRTRLD